MLIEAGFDIAFECPAQTPMLLQLNVHPSRDADLFTPDRIASDPPLSMRAYLDLFGNRVTRVEAPAGLVTFSNRFVIHDSGEPDETPPDVRTTPITDLPDDVLLFLARAGIATATSSPISLGRGSENCPAARGSSSAISFTRKSASATRMRARPAARAIPCTKASASAATSPISLSRSAAA
jgi:hypothetical protein